MLTGISWANFFIVAIILLCCYYLVVVLLYYRAELKHFISSGLKRSSSEDEQDAPANAMAFALYEKIIKQVDQALDRADKATGKPEVIALLRPILREYSNTRKPGYMAAILNHSIRKAEDKCGVWISAQELVGDE